MTLVGYGLITTHFIKTIYFYVLQHEQGNKLVLWVLTSGLG
jgi:hypothetical protein